MLTLPRRSLGYGLRTEKFSISAWSQKHRSAAVRYPGAESVEWIWAELTMGQKRAILADVLIVIVKPGGTRSTSFADDNGNCR